MFKHLFFIAISCVLISCNSYDYGSKTDRDPSYIENEKVYRVDSHDQLKRDRRLERIQSQGRMDNSSDGGAQFGW